MTSASTTPRSLLPILAVVASLACFQEACSLRSLNYLKNGSKQDGAMLDSAAKDVAVLSTPSLDTAIVGGLDRDTLDVDASAIGANDDVAIGGTGGAGGSGEVDLGTGGSGAGGTEAIGTGTETSGGGSFGIGGMAAMGGNSSTGGSPGTGGLDAEGDATATGGVSATGGTPSTGGETGTDGSSSIPCAGTLYSAICWYLATEGESCTQTCDSHGGPSSLAASHVGTSAQGGSRAECADILSLLGVAGSVQSIASIVGVGCISYLGTTASGPGLYWVNTPNFSANASLEGARPACGCLQ